MIINLTYEMISMTEQYPIVCPYHAQCHFMGATEVPKLIAKQDGKYYCRVCPRAETGRAGKCAVLENLNLLERIAQSLERRGNKHGTCCVSRGR